VPDRVYEREVEMFRQHGGSVRMAEALRLGINRKTLYAMRDAGVGMDVVLEALRLWRERSRKKLDVLLEYARMRHVERAMRPYLEATQ